MKLRRLLTAAVLAWVLMPFSSVMAMTGLFAAYNMDATTAPDRQGVIVHLIRVKNIGQPGVTTETFTLHLPEAMQIGKHNRQYLTRLTAVDDNHPVFATPNGHIYLFDLSSPPAGTFYTPVASTQMLRSVHGCARYQSQPEKTGRHSSAANAMAKLFLNHTQLSPISLSTVFSTPNGNDQFIVVSDDYSFLLEIPAPESDTDPLRMNLRPYPGNNMVRPRVRGREDHRDYISTGVDFVTSPNGSMHLVASLDSSKRDTKGVDKGREMFIYQLDLTPSSSHEWVQTSVSQSSRNLVRDYIGVAPVPDSANTGDCFDFCTTVTSSLVCMQLHHHTRAYCKNILAPVASGLPEDHNLGFFIGPHSAEDQDPVLKKNHDVYRVMMRPSGDNIYAVVAEASAAGPVYKLKKASLPDVAVVNPKSVLDWQRCCTIGSLPQGFHTNMLEQFVLLDGPKLRLDYELP